MARMLQGTIVAHHNLFVVSQPLNVGRACDRLGSVDSQSGSGNSQSGGEDCRSAS